MGYKKNAHSYCGIKNPYFIKYCTYAQVVPKLSLNNRINVTGKKLFPIENKIRTLLDNKIKQSIKISTLIKVVPN